MAQNISYFYSSFTHCNLSSHLSVPRPNGPSSRYLQSFPLLPGQAFEWVARPSIAHLQLSAIPAGTSGATSVGRG